MLVIRDIRILMGQKTTQFASNWIKWKSEPIQLRNIASIF